MVRLVLVAGALASPAAAFMDQFFQQQHRQQQQQQQREVSHDHEAVFMNIKCSGYLCQDTLACVSGPVDCPCPFPNSQEKCVYPGGEGYVCVSKGDRGCEWVDKAYNGLV